MPLSELDKYDIQESFQVLDEGREGSLPLQAIHTIFLGLGFGKLNFEDWKSTFLEVADDKRSFTMDESIVLLSRVSFYLDLSSL